MNFSILILPLSAGVFCACGGQPPPPQTPPSGQNAPEPKCVATTVTLEKPLAGETDQVSLTAAGKVDNSCASAWVVVHPAGTSDYYVQAQPKVAPDGSWLATVALGDAAQGAGKTFEVVVFANPTAEMKEGQVLAEWPQADARSDIVEVKRAEATPPPPPPPPKPECKLAIVEPAQGGRVGDRPDVRVEASEECELKSVWIVVHPTAVSTYWVQPRTSERQGVWKTKMHIGRPGRDWNAEFEVKAIGDPSGSLSEGDELSYWPEGVAESEMIEITKGR